MKHTPGKKSGYNVAPVKEGPQKVVKEKRVPRKGARPKGNKKGIKGVLGPPPRKGGKTKRPEKRGKETIYTPRSLPQSKKGFPGKPVRGKGKKKTKKGSARN